MRRQEYELIAAAIRTCYECTHNDAEKYGVKRVALKIADRLAADKPAFDYHQFLSNAGVRA